MPFRDNDDAMGLLALPEDFDLDPETEETASETSVLGAAFRLENPIASRMNSFELDDEAPFDPSYRPWEDIQGTVYEDYSDRFLESRNADQTAKMKAQIDRELEDRRAIDAAGGWGFAAEMFAGTLSPSMLLPGGQIAKTAKGGVSIAKSALSVGTATGVAVTLDEMSLQGSQQTRTPEESVYAIGGSVILGGILGSAAGSMSKRAFKRSSAQLMEAQEAVEKLNDGLRSVGAAENKKDFTLFREGLFQAVNKIPVMRALVRSDPLLRGQLSDIDAAREFVAETFETVLQYRINEEGQSVAGPDGPVETRIKTRRNTELVKSYSHLNKNYADYVNDGEVGSIGRITAPLTGPFQHLAGYNKKMSRSEFQREIGLAMFSGDVHPIPQVQKAAEDLRRNIFDKIKDDAIEAGMFDPELQLKNGESYLTRSYNIQKIIDHWRSGDDNDFAALMESEFKRKRQEAQNRLAFDDTVDQLEAEKFKLKELARTAQTAFRKGRKKLTEKRERARGAVSREGKVGRVSASLRNALEGRSEDLQEGLLQGEELDAFKASLRQARGVKNLEPQDMLSAIRSMGGVRDDGSGELQSALDTSINTVKRSDGMNADDMRGSLEELGYLPEGSTEADFWDALRESAAGNKIYSSFDAEAVEEFNAVMEFRKALEDLGVDVSMKADDIIKALPDMARNQKTTKAKADEAMRSAGKAGEKETTAEGQLYKAIDRLEQVKADLKEFDEIVGPKVRKEISEAQAELKRVLPELKKAKAARSADEYYAGLDDLEITSAADDVKTSLQGLKPGQHSYSVAMASPTRARALDIADEKLLPWLETDISRVMGDYFDAMVPDVELMRRYGTVDFTRTDAYQKIVDEADRAMANADTVKERRRLETEKAERLKDFQGMWDRMRGQYGVPKDPDNVFVRGGRVARTLSYTGYLGGMTLSAIPDVAGVVGRNGVEAAFGSVSAVTDPKRFGMALKDQAELGSAAEWFLNNRAMAISEVTNPYGRSSKFERGLGQVAQGFGVATGMVPWNTAWKTIGGAYSASRMSKAAVDASKGKATKKQIRQLAAAGIDNAMMDRIAIQIERHADTDGTLWLPQAGKWDDADAFEAFKQAMNREMDLMVVTPGQDKPLTFSTETGKFFAQFKSFAMSAHHRILLSGIQRADADVASQFAVATVLGGLVSNIKADLGGYERKEGADFYVDAFDRSGLSGWLMEAYNVQAGLNLVPLATGGRFDGRIGDEPVSRYMSRSVAEGALGPSVDMGLNMATSVSAMGRGDMTERDVRNLMRPIPGNNLPYIVNTLKDIAEAVAD